MALQAGLDKRTRTATALSGQEPVRGQARPLFRLARTSLVLASVMTLASGCIIADPPQYHDPLQTPPVLDLYQANPSVQNVVVVKSGQAASVSFVVPFRSEDAGEGLLAELYVDGVFSIFTTFDASSFNDLGRSVKMALTVTPAIRPGCHTVTITIAHQSTWDTTSAPETLNLKKATYDAATATWWLNVDPPEGAELTLNNCPKPVVQSQ